MVADDHGPFRNLLGVLSRIGEERFEVKLPEGLIDESYQVVRGQFGFESESLGVLWMPGKRGKTAGALV